MANETPLLFVEPASSETELVFGGSSAARPTDLLFFENPASNGNLVFGAGDGAHAGDSYTLSSEIVLPGITGAVNLALAYLVNSSLTLPGLTGGATVTYNNDVVRPEVSRAKSIVSVAMTSESGVGSIVHQSVQTHPEVLSILQDAKKISEQVSSLCLDSARYVEVLSSHMQDGSALQLGALGSRMQDADPGRRVNNTGVFQEGTAQGSALGGRFQEAYHDRRRWVEAAWQVAQPRRVGIKTGYTKAIRSLTLFGGRYQDAWPPRAGIWVRPGPPVIPPVPVSWDLLFVCPQLYSPHLLFGQDCTPQPVGVVVVPIRRVYIVINTASLRRVDGNVMLPTFGMSLSLDADSWTWGFRATLPGAALADLEPSSAGVPVEVEAMVNGLPFRALIESVSRSRSFGSNTISVEGRGKSALLDAPYAPVLNFGNTIERTSQQLMDDVLTLNGQPMGWTVDWGITAWTVPEGAFNHQGSYISALNAIAGSVDAYIQPHPTAQSLSVFPRYPDTPWKWGALTPDYELPSAVTLTEGIQWVDRARYNRVFVSGEAGGVLGQVTRQGTAGDVLAPMVTDPLITHVDAARQRGLSILSKTGRSANVSLKLPVLPETGVITPGKLVRYIDGGVTRLGLVRNVDVDVSMPEIFQSIGVETYVN